MQWRKLARTKITAGRSRTRAMLCCGRRKENGREVPDITASPGRAPPPHHPNQQQPGQLLQPGQRPGHPPPMVIQGDFRKVSGISTEIFKQIETVENDHDATTAAALEAVERRGEMIVRILDPRHLGRAASDAAKRFLALQDAKHAVQLVEIVKRPGQTLGLYIREGNGVDRPDGVFISRIALESAVYNSGCLKVGDEILAVNLVDVTRMSLDDVVIIMSIPRRLVLATRQRKGAKGMNSPVQPRAEHKPPPVVVIKRDLRDEDADEDDGPGHGGVGGGHRDPPRQRHTGDGREMSESRSHLGLGLGGYGPESNGGLVDLYYNSRPPDGSGNSWGYQPPPPVITEQPKAGGPHHFQTGGGYERPGYPKTLESLAEKVHSFYGGPPGAAAAAARRMSAGGQPLTRLPGGGQAGGPGHYYVQHGGTGSRRLMPRSGSDQHLPRVEYSDYTSITQAGRHSLLRSSLKSGSTLSRYNQRYVNDPSSGVPGMPGVGGVSSSLGQSKYGVVTGAGGGSAYGGASASGTLTRRNRSSLDYSSDTEATCGPRSSYYYYRNQSAIPHSTIPTLGRNNMTSTDITTKFNSLPRDTRGATRMQLTKRFGDRSTISLLSQDESDGALSAPEMPTRRDRGRIPSSPSVFTSDEYRAWLSRTPSTSAIYEQIRASRDVLNQQRAARFTYSAENIHAALKDVRDYLSSYYGGYPTGARGGLTTTSTLDRHFSASRHHHNQSAPARSMSSHHITTGAAGSTVGLGGAGAGASRSPSMRRMRHLLELEQSRLGPIPNPSPVPTPSGTLPRSGARQIDINPAEFLKYKVDKPTMGSVQGLPGLALTSAAASHVEGERGVSGMLWVHLLAGRGLRSAAVGSAATTPVTPSGTSPALGSTGLRDLYCVLECDRVHKARTVVRTGDLVFDWDESFELDLVNNRELDLLIYSWDPQYRHKLCYKGSVHLPSLLRDSPLHQLALKIEPRGTLYLRLRHTDSTQLYRRRGLPALTGPRSSAGSGSLFGADLETVVGREARTGGVPGGVATGLAAAAGPAAQVPVIVRRCVEEIERRGLDIIGLYRLCGSATKKRVLREAFERNSRSVDLTPDNVPDINVITGVLKDYLRELPEPLFTKCLYQMLVDALGVCLPDDPEGNAKLMFSILDCLPRINRATLIFLMDHLALVVSACDRNKMSAQNLAVAMGPPLMLHASTSDSSQGGGVSVSLSVVGAELEYEQPIGVLKYLLQIWPAPKGQSGPYFQTGRRAKPAVARGDIRSASLLERGPGPGAPHHPHPPLQLQASAGSLAGGVRGLSRPSAAASQVQARSAALPAQQVSAVSVGRAPSPQTRGPSPAGGLARTPRASPAPLSAGPAGQRPAPPPGPYTTCSLQQQQQQQGPRPRQVIVSSPGSPSSSSDSQSGSDSVKHYQTSSSTLPSATTSSSARVGSPGLRRSPSAGPCGGGGAAASAVVAATPTGGGPSSLRASPSPLGRASPALSAQLSRSSSPAMQASSAGLAVTMTPAGGSAHHGHGHGHGHGAGAYHMSTTTTGSGGGTYQGYAGYATGGTASYSSSSTSGPAYSTSYSTPTSAYSQGATYSTSSAYQPSTAYSTGPSYSTSSAYTSAPYTSSAYTSSGYPTQASSAYTSSAYTSSYKSADAPSTTYAAPFTQYPSTNPFVTGAYMQSFTPTEAYAEMRLNGNDKLYDGERYKGGYEGGGSTTTTGNGLFTKSGYFEAERNADYQAGRSGEYTSGGARNGEYGGGHGNLLGVEETPTPTSSIETEDSAGREVGERDVEGDVEQSD